MLKRFIRLADINISTIYFSDSCERLAKQRNANVEINVRVINSDGLNVWIALMLFTMRSNQEKIRRFQFLYTIQKLSAIDILAVRFKRLYAFER